MNDFLLGQEIINLEPVSSKGIVRNFSEDSIASKILLTIISKKNVGILDQLKWSKLALFQ